MREDGLGGTAEGRAGGRKGALSGKRGGKEWRAKRSGRICVAGDEGQSESLLSAVQGGSGKRTVQEVLGRRLVEGSAEG